MPTQRLPPEYQDPAGFPCAVVRCDERAAGWVHHGSMEMFGLAYEVRSETELVYLCAEHLAPVRGG